MTKLNEIVEGLKQEASEMSIVVKFGKQCVIRPIEREDAICRTGKGKEMIIPMPDFAETGYSLCGILKEGETFELFKKRWVRKKKKIILEALAKAEYQRKRYQGRKKTAENVV